MEIRFHDALNFRRARAQQKLLAALWHATQAQGMADAPAYASERRALQLAELGYSELADCDRLEREHKRARRKSRPVPFARWDPC